MTLIAGPGRGLGEVGRDISSERRSAKFNTRIQQKIKIRIKNQKSLYYVTNKYLILKSIEMKK